MNIFQEFKAPSFTKDCRAVLLTVSSSACATSRLRRAGISASGRGRHSHPSRTQPTLGAQPPQPASPCSCSVRTQTTRSAGKQDRVFFSASKCVVLAKLFVPFCKVGAEEICLEIPPHSAVLSAKGNDDCKWHVLSLPLCSCHWDATMWGGSFPQGVTRREQSFYHLKIKI